MQKGNVERRRRMGFIKEILEHQKMAEKDKLIGQLMMHFGVSKRDAREEIDGVIQAMEWELKGNLIIAEIPKKENEAEKKS